MLLLFAGQRWSNIATFEQIVAKIVWPIQFMVDRPIHAIEQIQSFFQERTQMLAENENLKQQHIYLQAQVQKLRALEAENQELRVLLQSTGRNTESFIEARLVHANVDPFSHQILLNKGKAQGVEAGQVIIDPNGLVGLVVSVNHQTSRVLLLTDTGFAVPVQSVRSGERAIATGSGSGGELRLNYVPQTADFVEGDQLVTSGLGGRFPAGYPVGVITSILQDPSTRFSLIGVSPSAKLGQLRHVLVLKPQAGSTLLIEPEDEEWKEVLLELSPVPEQPQKKKIANAVQPQASETKTKLPVLEVKKKQSDSGMNQSQPVPVINKTLLSEEGEEEEVAGAAEINQEADDEEEGIE